MKTITLKLSDDVIAKLEALAIEHQSLAKAGPTTGKPSWRAMINDLGSGKIFLTRSKNQPAKSPAEPKAPKAKKPWKGYWKHRASWWEPYDGNFMLTGEVVEKSGLTVDQLVAGGLMLADDGETVESPAKWGGWKYNKADAARDR